MKFKNFQSGMSIVEIMVALGLLGAVSLGVMKIMDNTQRASKNLETKDEITQLSHELNEILSNASNCHVTFLGKHLGDEVMSINVPFHTPSGVIPQPKITVGQAIRNNVIFKSAVIKAVDLNSSDGDKSIIDFEVVFEKKDNFARIGGKQLKKIIKLHANLCPQITLTGGQNFNFFQACSGAGKKLITGVSSATTAAGVVEKWAVCQDCSGITENSPIESCNSMSTGSGIDVGSFSQSSCLTLGGTIDPETGMCQFNDESLQDTLASLNERICELEKENYIQKGEIVTKTLCGKTFKIEDKTQLMTGAGNKSFSLPANYVPETLVVTMLGGGGGGGKGCSDCGGGGGAGSVVTVLANKTHIGGTSISGFVGNGGGSSGDNGDPGGATSINLNGVTHTASGGSGGTKSRGSYCGGGGVMFMGTWYSGGTYHPNQQGEGGQMGAGGAGGEYLDVDCRTGGDGGSGAIHFRWREWSET